MLPPKRKGKDGRKNNKPPKQYQFKKGESGNKKGRPKKTPTVLDLMEQELNSLHSVNIGTKQIRVPLKFLLVKQFFRAALKGDNKALFRSLEILDTIQKANAKRYSDSLRPRFNSEDLKNMSEDQLTKLYCETLEQVRGDDEDDD